MIYEKYLILDCHIHGVNMCMYIYIIIFMYVYINMYYVMMTCNDDIQ